MFNRNFVLRTYFIELNMNFMHTYSTMHEQVSAYGRRGYIWLILSIVQFQPELKNIKFAFKKHQICALLTNDLISWSSYILRVVVTDPIGGIAKHCNVSTIVY